VKVGILTYCYEIWTVEYRLKKMLLIIGMEFSRKAERSSKILKVRNEIIKRRHRITKLWKE
jgi:hypothetical protein